MNARLNRTLTLWPLTLYGIGTILGAGIYVIISEVAFEAGPAFPLSFVVAAIIAGLSSLSYAELSSRFPQSAGEAVYVKQAFSIPALTRLVGYGVAFTGVMSSATILRGFHGYLSLFIQTPEWLCTTVLAILLIIVAVKGVKESALVVGIITLIEVSGLLLVVFVGAPLVVDNSGLVFSSMGQVDASIFVGAFVAFFAFVGFEDMVNMAEETKDAEKVVPKAILLALLISTVLYFAVAVSALAALSLEDLTQSKAPLSLILDRHSSLPHELMGFIGMVAIINGGLVQLIMVSRIIYGMARLQRAPQIFGRISEKTQTPIIATVTFGLIIWVLALTVEINNLAKLTSFIVLSVFALVSLSLIKIKRAGRERPGFHVPIAVPVLGALSCLLLLGFMIFR